jgi:hypothetical protein
VQIEGTCFPIQTSKSSTPSTANPASDMPV